VKRGDIYLVSLDPIQGHERQGTRPVQVVSPDRFNAITRVPIVVPITSDAAFARTAGFAVSLSSAGTARPALSAAISPACSISPHGRPEGSKAFTKNFSMTC
jgi:mRNA-degrading endonuclease toxin of MazEF toxin-antitoxin module